MNAIGNAMALGVALRDGQGCGRNVRCVDRRGGKFLGESDGDAAGAGADVGDLEAFASEGLFAAGAAFANGEAIEGDFDDVFGFGAGNQDVGCYFKFEAPEFLLAGEMLRRLAVGTARNKREVSLGNCAGDLLFGMRVKPGAVAAENVEEQKLRGEREGRDVRFAQLGEPLFQRGANIDLRFSGTHCGTRRERIGKINAETRSSQRDRKSTRLNSSHMSISYAVFCL